MVGGDPVIDFGLSRGYGRWFGEIFKLCTEYKPVGLNSLKVIFMEIRVSMTDICPHLSELIGKVEFGGDKIVIERFRVPTRRWCRWVIWRGFTGRRRMRLPRH